MSGRSGYPVFLMLVLFSAALSPLIGRAPTPDDRLAEIESQYESGFYRKTLELCREGAEELTGDARHRCLEIWAHCAEKQRQWDDVRVLYERELDRVPLKTAATLAEVEGRRRAKSWGGWSKLEPSEKALALWEQGGSAYREQWCATAFELIEGLSVSWQHDMDPSEWEKEEKPTDPEQLARAYEVWKTVRGIAEDKRRWERTETLFAGILELAPNTELKARALFERGIRRLVSVGAVPGIDRLRSSEIETLIEQLKLLEDGKPAADALEAWRTKALASIADWRTLVERFPNERLADDACYLIPYATEIYLVHLVDAVDEYRAFLEKYPESQWTSDARGRSEEILREGVQLAGDVRLVPPGTQPEVEVEARNVETLTASLWRIPDYLDRVENQTALVAAPESLASGVPDWTWQIATECTDDHKARRVKVTLPTDAAGAYRLRVEGKASRIDLPVFVSGLALDVEGGSDEAFAWVTSSVDGKPVFGSEVLIRLDIRRHKEYRSWTTRLETGSDGLVRWRYPERFMPLLADGWRLHRLAAVAQLGAEISPSPSFSPTYDSGRQPRLHYYLETDRPVFRPGQKVGFKITLRQWNGKTYELPKEATAVSWSFLDPQGSPLLEKTSTTDEFGAISGTVTLSSEVTLGMCSLRVKRNNQEIPPRNWQREAFRVEEYRRPEFEVTIQAPDEPVLYGDPLQVIVRGNFLSGEPVRGGKVRIRVQRSPYWFAWQPPSPYPWRKERQHNYWSSEDVYSGEATLDGEGNAEFTVPTSERGDALDSNYQVEAWLTDASQREETSTTSFPVTRTALFAHLEPKVQIVSPGEPIEVTVRIMDASERDRSATGVIEIAKRVDRIEERDGEKIPVIDWEPIATKPFGVEAGGSEFREIATVEGQLRVTFRGDDGRGHPFESATQLWVVGPNFTGRDYTLDGLQVVTQTPVARIGTVARALILTERTDATILVLRSAAGRILSLETVQAKGHVAQFSFPVTDAEAPNFFLNAWAVWDGTMHRANGSIEVPPDPYFLDGVLATSDLDLLPGAEATLDLTLKDHTGQPVEGAWSLALFDRAVLAIQPEIAKSPMQHFHERRWSFTLRGTNSIHYRSSRSFSWFEGHKPLDRTTHPLPDLLRRTWQRRFSYLANSFFAQASAVEALGLTSWDYGGQGGGGGLTVGSSLEAGAARFSPPMSEADSSPARGGRELQRSRGKSAKKGADDGRFDDSENEDGGVEMAAVRIRSNFSETAMWEPNFHTDATGRGSLKVTLPDSLTEWRGIARGIASQGRTFEARVQLRPRRNIRLRLATTRFLREGDEVVFSLVASNQFDAAVSGRVHLDFPLALLDYRGQASVETDNSKRGSLSFPVDLPAKGEVTFDVPFAVTGIGEVHLIAMIATPRESDGIERSLSVLPYGLERLLGGAGIVADIDGPSSDSWTFAIPELSDPESRSLTVDLTPSAAIALIESLPYLVRYPYGCVEQTLNRFVPALVVAELLKETGVDLTEILPERPAQIPVGFWGHLDERPLELFRPEDLSHLLEVGKSKLQRAQNGDGSWGWWRGYDGDPYITALVVEHLCTAKEIGVPIDDNVLRAGAQWLVRHAVGRDFDGELDIYERPGIEELTWVTRALLHAGRLQLIPINDDSDGLYPLLDFLYKVRDRLGAQGKSLFALALHDSDRGADHERARVLIGSLYDTEGGQDRFGTVHFGRNNAYSWYDHGVESTAWALRALIEISPEDDRIPRVVRWLLENRAGSHYDSTRSTATVALALTAYLRKTGELDCDLSAEVLLDGTSVGTFEVDRKSLFSKRGRITVPAHLLEAGEHTVEIHRSGNGPLYWSSMVEFYSREDPVPAGGNRVEIARRAYRLVDRKVPRTEKYIREGQTIDRTVEEWITERQPLPEGAVVAAGDRVLVEIEVLSANTFRYVKLENPKPAGFETVASQSGFVGGVYGYRELRDEKVVWFVSRLPEGPSKVEIELRAERDGRFRIVPATIEAMYLPHVRGNSTSGTLGID